MQLKEQGGTPSRAVAGASARRLRPHLHRGAHIALIDMTPGRSREGEHRFDGARLCAFTRASPTSRRKSRLRRRSSMRRSPTSGGST